MNESSSIIHDQMGKNNFVWFHGVVEDIKDPKEMGRVRVRCFEYHNANKQLLPTEHLPWATLLQSNNSAAVSGKGISPTGLLQGSWVVGFFRDGHNCQDPIILGSFASWPTEESNPKLGFNDPQGKYPSKKYKGLPDINRLARTNSGGSIEGTIVKEKKDKRIKGVKVALLPSVTWDEKETSYGAEYPKNHVMETESGHIIELDDTPKKERIGIYHKAGTWIEIHPDGSRVQKIKGDDYEIALSDKKLLVKGNCYMNVDGAITTLKTGKDFYIEIGGDARVLVRGNVVMETGKNFEHRVHGTYTVSSNGNMAFVAPRIDFNPSGVKPSLASSPNLGSGKTIPPLLKDVGVAPNTEIEKAISQGKGLNSDYLKNLNQELPIQKIAQEHFKDINVDAVTKQVSWQEAEKLGVKLGSSALPFPYSAIPLDSSLLLGSEVIKNNVIKRQAEQLSDMAALKTVGIQDSLDTKLTQESLAKQTSQLSSVISPGSVVGSNMEFPALSGEVGGIPSEPSILTQPQGLQVDLPVGAASPQSTIPTASNIGFDKIIPIGAAVGGLAVGLVKVFGSSSAPQQAVQQNANVAAATLPSPAEQAQSEQQTTQNTSAIPLPPVAAGMAGQSIADTNLVDIGSPGLPTTSLFAIPGKTATLIEGYPGRSENSSATTAIPAIPIIGFHSEFPSMTPEEITEIDGGEF